MLYIIGIGLNNEKDITLKGLEAVRKCEYVYLESYTSLLQCPVSKLERLYKKKIILANRELVESQAEQTILKNAKNSDVAFLVVGDAFSATTHLDLMLRAKKLEIKTEIVNNASVLTAVGITGLQLYKFGKTTSIPFFDERQTVETPYSVLEQNLQHGLHTLFLLDIDAPAKRFMTVNDAIEILLKIEDKKKKKIFTPDTMCIGCARLGGDYKIKSGKAKDIAKADFGKPPHCLVVAGKLHFMEEEALKNYLHCPK